MRNPRTREAIQDFEERLMKNLMQHTVSSPEKWESTVRGAAAAGHLFGEPPLNYEMMKEFVDRDEYSVEFAREGHIALELDTFDKILPYLFNRKWKLLRAPLGSVGFVTSDHPSCLTWDGPTGSIFPPGLALRHTELIFPISKELATVGTFDGDDEVIDANEYQVALVNGFIIAFAEQQIYAQNEGFSYRRSPDDPIRPGAGLRDDGEFANSERPAP